MNGSVSKRGTKETIQRREGGGTSRQTRLRSVITILLCPSHPSQRYSSSSFLVPFCVSLHRQLLCSSNELRRAAHCHPIHPYTPSTPPLPLFVSLPCPSLLVMSSSVFERTRALHADVEEIREQLLQQIQTNTNSVRRREHTHTHTQRHACLG